MSEIHRQLPASSIPATGTSGKRRHSLRRALKTTGLLALTALGITLASTGANAFLELHEKSSIARYGDLVEVAGGSMNVVRDGTTGAQPLVLLSGLGTTAPGLDFAPLVRELGAYDVIVVEGFGYGYSDLSAPARTVENISSELHEVLTTLDIDEPYVLAGHSIAGFYTLDYANRYPGEVSAVIGIDPTVPAADARTATAPTDETASAGGINVLGVLSTIGLVRAVVAIAPSLADPSSDAFTPAELEQMRRMTSWNFGNPAVADETARMSSNAAALKGMTYPDDMPVLHLLASDSITNIPHWLTKHENQLRNVSRHDIIQLEGPHYLHWTQAKTMATKIAGFLEENVSSPAPSASVDAAAATEGS